MLKVPKFILYGIGDSQVEENIQPHLNLRGWLDLSVEEKEIALQELINKGWIEDYSGEILGAIKHLNLHFLRKCPGKNLHHVKPRRDYRGIGNDSEQTEAAIQDFKHIFLHENKSEDLVLRMLTAFADGHIKKYYLQQCNNIKDGKRIEESINNAFEKFDQLTSCLNHIFEQFSVNVILTRNGLTPRQDRIITEKIYVPTMRILSDLKWKTVSDDIALMFDNYHQRYFSETITIAHRIVQRFLQILVGEEGKNSKGELANLFRKAKKQNLIPIDRFTEPLINVFQSFISSERATKSTAKPLKEEATSHNALLMMNVVVVFLQHCLQKNK